MLQTRFRIKGTTPSYEIGDETTVIRLNWMVAPRKPETFEMELLSLADDALNDAPNDDSDGTSSGPLESVPQHSNFQESMVRLKHRAWSGITIRRGLCRTTMTSMK